MTDKSKTTLPSRYPSIRERLLNAFNMVRQICYIFIWLGLLGGVGYGLDWCRRYALSLPPYNQPVHISLANLPDWLRNPANKHIRDQVIRSAGLIGSDAANNDNLPLTVAMNLTKCPWVRQVVSVKKLADGLVEVNCEYRRPLVWVRSKGKCYLVDDRAVRLPGEYDPSSTVGTGLLRVVGVSDPPPQIGRTWPGDDLMAAIRLANMVQGRPIQKQISAILVHNYAGRADPLSPDIELTTDRPGSKIRWGHAPGEELPTEPTAEQKLALLEHYLQTYGRVDLGKSYIDIRTWPAFQPVQGPTTAEEAPKNGLRNRTVDLTRTKT